MFVLHPVPKSYAWGSYRRLQTMFRDRPTADGDAMTVNPVKIGQPLAEMWFSGHQQWPSTVEIPGRGPLPLTHAIHDDPRGMVGERDSGQFGPVLPYLLKIISARMPLSMQVHPVGFEARAGFNAENASGIAMDSPIRSFHDPVEKCEMVVALEPFEASVGFSSIPFMIHNLKLVDHPVAATMVEALSRRLSLRGYVASTTDSFAEAEAFMPDSASVWPESRRQVFRAFFTAITAGPVSGLADALMAASEQSTHARAQLAFHYAIAAARDFGDDPSVLGLLMMNPVRLDEGESVFIPAGTPHAYIHGTAVEIMTNSDNVLRAGMTVKHKDINHLLHTLDCRSSAPIDPAATNLVSLIMRDIVVYKPDVDAFMLAYGHVDAGQRRWMMLDHLVHRYGRLIQHIGVDSALPGSKGPRVLVCTQGSIRCSSPRDERVLRCGEAVFIPADEGLVFIAALDDPLESSSGSFIVASTQV